MPATVVGSTEAHGRSWPLYERPAFGVEVVGSIDAVDLDSPEALAGQLRQILDRYGVTVRVYPVRRMVTTPEDQAEKNALDEATLREAGY